MDSSGSIRVLRRSNLCFYSFCSLSVSSKHVHGLKIREEIKRFGINIYQFPECDSDEDEDFKTHDQMLKVLLRSVFLLIEICRRIHLKADGPFVFRLLSAGQHPVRSNRE